jgi:1-acyl-sn-glycerol-3-phosphate acyltransferase
MPGMWVPKSTCDSHCMPRSGTVPRVSPLIVAARIVGLLAMILAACFVPLLPAKRVPEALRMFARGVLFAAGVRHRATGRLAQHGTLLASNHVSWLDVLVLMAYTPCTLLAKREVGRWPVIGRLATATGTLYIDRQRPRTLPDTVAAVACALRDGAVVAVFPEGTTWCGLASGRFRPAMFQAAVTTGAPVAPVRLDFRLPDGSATSVAAFIGEGALLDSIWRVITTRGLRLTLQAYPALYPTRGTSRRALASTVRAVICPEVPEQHPATAMPLELTPNRGPEPKREPEKLAA